MENVSFLRLFSECQGTFKGYFADIKGNNNFSMVDTIKNIVKFRIMQKDYRYKRKTEGCNQNGNTKF